VRGRGEGEEERKKGRRGEEGEEGGREGGMDGLCENREKGGLQQPVVVWVWQCSGVVWGGCK